MKHTRSKTARVLVLLLIAAQVLLICACGNDPQPEDPINENTVDVNLDVNAISIDTYDTVKLNATVKNSTSPVVWTSSDSSIATVSNGTVTGVAAGTATVTASVGSAKAECTVTVKISRNAPSLQVSKDDIHLLVGSSFPISASATWKGEPNDATVYGFTVDENSESILSVTDLGGGNAEVRGVGAGEGTLIISAKLNGMLVTKTVSVKVQNSNIQFEISNFEPSIGYYTATVFTAESALGSNRLTPQVTIYKNGVQVQDPTVIWTSDNTSVLSVENGVLVGHAVGVANLTGTYEGETVRAEIRVIRASVRLDDKIVIETSDLKPITIPATITDSVKRVTVGNHTVFEGDATGILNLDPTKMPKKASELGDVTLVMSTETADYVISASIYTLIIHTKEDLDMIGTLSAAVADTAGKRDGYYVLANNISYTGSFETIAPYSDVYASAGNNGIKGISGGFAGVFDGCGYVIDGLTVSGTNYGGIFGVMHRDGVVKNVGFTNAKSLGTAFLCSDGAGTFRNIYVKVSEISGGSDERRAGMLYTNSVADGARAESCFFDYNDCIYTGTVTQSDTVLIGRSFASARTVYMGVYCVSKSTLRTAPVVGVQPSDVAAAFRTYSDLTKNADAMSVISNWDSSFWSTDTNRCPVPKTSVS